MRFGLMMIPYDRWPDLDAMAEVAVAAESLGFEDLVFGEHLFTPANGQHESLGTTWPELYVLSSYLAAKTERIRFTYNATVIPYRHPIHQAVEVATLDQAHNENPHALLPGFRTVHRPESNKHPVARNKHV